MKMNTHHNAMRRERGATLIISMILLMVVTLLAVTSLRTTIQEERASASAYDRNLAFQSAEAGLRVGEAQAAKWVEGALPTPLPELTDPPAAIPCTAVSADGLYGGPIDPGCNLTETILRNGCAPTTAADNFDDDDPANSNSLRACYIVEYLTAKALCNPKEPITEESIYECKRFRVTARSHDAAGRALITLQSIYAVGPASE
ncbi:MAG: hypothetical protein LBB76_03425 [Azoarcus sp.]|jgi:type IV pilus assembly protein PilX|nr:hypothetical protein [Azoarcus sp.]